MVLYAEHASNETLLHDVQRLLDIPPVQFPELIRTKEDLQYTEELYGTYSKFLDFDKKLVNSNFVSVCILKYCNVLVLYRSTNYIEIITLKFNVELL